MHARDGTLDALRGVFAVLSFLLACGDGGTEIRVDLRTDYVPGGDFSAVVVAIEGEEQRTDVDFETDVFTGVRVGRFDVSAGIHRIQTRLLDSAGAEVDTRLMVVEANGATGVTVLMDRSCRALQCEDACFAGRCQDPSCSPETPEACEAECTVDSDCAAPTACGRAQCVAGACFEMRDDGMCADDEWCSPDSGCVPRQVATMSPTFPANGALWNQYVVASGAPWESGDEACDPNADRFTACLHGGEHRTVTVDGISSCDDVDASDALGLFEWACVAGDDQIQLHSTRLAPYARVRNLIDRDTQRFHENWVEVSAPGFRWATAPSIWWKNPIRRVDNPAGAIDANPFEILVVPNAMTTGVSLSANNVAFVVDGTLTASAPGVSCLDDRPSRCLLDVTGNFNWIEGVFDADGVDNLFAAVSVHDARFNRIRHVRVRATDMDPPSTTGALNLARVHASRLHELVSHDAGHTGIRLDDSDGNELADSRVSDTRIYGVMLGSSVNNVVRNVHVNGSSHEAFWLAGGSLNNTLVSSRATGIDQARVILFGGTQNTGHRLLAANIRGDGYHFQANNAVSQLVAFDVTGVGLRVSSPGLRLMHYACLHCQTSNIEMTATGSMDARGEFYLGASMTPCSVDAMAEGLDATCAPQDASTANVRTGVTASDDYGRFVSTDDTNPADPISAQEELDPDAWSEFDRFERGWGLNHAPGEPSDRRACKGGQTCRMWEWSLAETSALRAVFDDSMPCFAGESMTDFADPPNTYFTSAVEIAYDFIGDEDGLCEAGEACIFTPHLGPAAIKPSNAVCETPEGVLLYQSLE